MIEQNDNAKEILMDTVIAKIDRQDEKSQDQDKRIAVVEYGLGETAHLASDIQEIKADVRSISDNGKQVKFTEGRLQELNRRLDSILVFLSKPLQSEVRHHHHFPAIAWATAGFFLALCLASTGWFMAGQRTEQFKANDFKYRYLKVFVDSAATVYLFSLDSGYAANPDGFQNIVVTRERLKQRRLELLYQIHNLDSQFEGGQYKAGEKKKSQK
jgi:hypothetical protein